MKSNGWRSVAILLAALVIPACDSGHSKDSAAGGTPVPGVEFSDPGIETFPDEGNQHVPVGTAVAYATDPPTSGPHYPDPQPGGFYTAEAASGFLVHAMEHGGVIIYYNSALLTTAQLSSLMDLGAAHPGTFAQVVVVPRNDPSYPIILTAWTHRLRLTAFDQNRIDGFLTLFLGKGPEHD
jgi:hypothetical protein